MDFVEQLFGISPDGGSGAYELTLLLTVLCLVALGALRRRLSRSHRGQN